MTKCSVCGCLWGGSRTGHCASCHQTFAGQLAFDAHRAGSHARGSRHCVEPEMAGLVDAGRGYPCWTLPEDEDPVDWGDDGV